MAVAVQLDFQGATLRQYDEINERIGSLPGRIPITRFRGRQAQVISLAPRQVEPR